MRFILNFIFFGILFFLIHIYFPEAFNTLVGWADKFYIFLRDLILNLYERFQHNPPAAPATAPVEHAMIMLPYLWQKLSGK